MTASGLETVTVERGEEMEAALADNLYAVVVVNPRVQSARSARRALEKFGGTISHIPLVAALSEGVMMADMDVLRYLDEVVLPPVDIDELRMRIEHVRLRRGLEGNVITSGELIINLDQHKVFLADRPIDLTFKEFELLKTLASTPGRAYSREDLLRNIWGYDYFGGTRTVDVHVRRVRSKIENTRPFIDTVHGVGYRFITETG